MFFSGRTSRLTTIVLTTALGALAFGCESDISLSQRSSALATPGSPGGGGGGGGGDTPTGGVPNNPKVKILTPVTDTFQLAVSRSKVIDFLFMVDNSGSMEDNQAALAEGFAKFANTFYTRTDLDICTHIITSDRYLGRRGDNNYQRERSLNCTKPAGSENWTPQQQQSHIMNLIADFKNKVNVGTKGSGTELGAKSVGTFLFDLDHWPAANQAPLDPNAPSTRNTFFRDNSVANISYLTDENNYFYTNDIAESDNDLPAYRNAPIPNSTFVDPRVGQKELLDYYFRGPMQDRALTYSVTSIIELSQSAYTLPGLATNLLELVTKVGRDSNKGDIRGSSNDYAALYDKVGTGIIARFDAFNTKSEIYEPNYPIVQYLKVIVNHPNGTKRALTPVTDYDFNPPNAIVIKSAISQTFVVGDTLEVDYDWMREVDAGGSN